MGLDGGKSTAQYFITAPYRSVFAKPLFSDPLKSEGIDLNLSRDYMPDTFSVVL